MTDGSVTYTKEAHDHHMGERNKLDDAARESSRTFDQAVLAFGAAVFGASVAFLKDVAPNPQKYTIKWLAISWVCFSVGLLAIILSFLFSHRACLFRIEESEHKLKNPTAPDLKNLWATRTDWCNFLCVFFLFLGVAAWTVFAIENLTFRGGSNEQPSSATVGASPKGSRAAEGSPSTTSPANCTTSTATASKEVK